VAEKSPRNYKCNFKEIFNHKFNAITQHPACLMPALQLAERAGVYVKGGYYVYATTLPWFS
jgi:hypothetical protein